MNNNSEKVIEITEDFIGLLFKHEATPEIGFDCVAALTMEITLRLCKATQILVECGKDGQPNQKGLQRIERYKKQYR